MKKRYWIAGAVTAVVAARLLTRPRDVVWEENCDIVFHSDYSHFVDVGGLRVHYQEAGSRTAQAVVLIHGFCSSTLVWSKVFLPTAAAGYHVIAPDLLGYGYSAKPRYGTYTIESQARMITGLLDKLGIQQAILVGSSYGGPVAATCALDSPDRVKKLVLVGSVINNEPTRYPLMRLFGAPIIGDIVSPLLVGSRRLLRMRMKKVYDKHSWILDERRVEARHRPLRASGTHRAIIRTVRNWDADRIQHDAHRIRQPTLLIWGEADPEIPLRHGERLHAEIGASRLTVFPECGHLPQEEYPEEFTRVVTQFCAREEFLPERRPQFIGAD